MARVNPDALVSRGDHGKSVGTHHSSPKGWYLGLDGVRAVAVFLVFSVHYLGHITLYVGWTGVLIFFVLSGFLITGILYDNQHEDYRFRNFYIRRTLRIFPLFYFSCVMVIIAASFLGTHWSALQVLWLTYLGNYVRFLAGNEVLDHIFTSRPQFPLEIGHFWSLAVEEQFYLIWPLIVFHVRERKQLIRICLSTVVGVLFLRIALWAVVPEKFLSMEILYRLTFTQCDGFLLGGLLALWMRGPEKESLQNHSGKILYGSVLLLMTTYLVNNSFHLRALSSTSGWMSTYGYSLVDMAAAGLILCSLKPGTVVYRFMTLWPLRLLGRYSYGFYVYHVLLLPFLRYYIFPVNPTWPKRTFYAYSSVALAADFLIVFAVSACSYHFLELPFLQMKDRFTMRRKNPDAQGVASGGE